MKEKLYIKDGSFYRGKEKVAPVFGDTEQIALIKEHEKYFELAKEAGGPMVEFDRSERVYVDVTAGFTCLCGRELKIHWEDKDEYFDESDTLGECKRCDRCKRNYILEVSETTGDTIAKIQE